MITALKGIFARDRHVALVPAWGIEWIVKWEEGKSPLIRSVQLLDSEVELINCLTESLCEAIEAALIKEIRK